MMGDRHPYSRLDEVRRQHPGTAVWRDGRGLCAWVPDEGDQLSGFQAHGATADELADQIDAG